jgi:hypothetical protein
LALDAAERLVEADDLLLLGLAAAFRAVDRAPPARPPVFFPRVFALRAGFLAIESPIRLIRLFRAAT